MNSVNLKKKYNKELATSNHKNNLDNFIGLLTLFYLDRGDTMVQQFQWKQTDYVVDDNIQQDLEKQVICSDALI